MDAVGGLGWEIFKRRPGTRCCARAERGEKEFSWRWRESGFLTATNGGREGGVEIASKISRKLFLSSFPHQKQQVIFPLRVPPACLRSAANEPAHARWLLKNAFTLRAFAILPAGGRQNHGGQKHSARNVPRSGGCPKERRASSRRPAAAPEARKHWPRGGVPCAHRGDLALRAMGRSAAGSSPLLSLLLENLSRGVCRVRW